jgi:hypothetical protein
MHDEELVEPKAALDNQLALPGHCQPDATNICDDIGIDLLSSYDEALVEQKAALDILLPVPLPCHPDLAFI